MARVEIILSSFPDLEKYKEHYTDFTPLLEELGIQAERLWVQIFGKEGDPKWAPLAETTLRRRRQEGKGAKILRDEGTLFKALTSRHGAGSVYKITPVSLEIGTNLSYAAVHQHGSQTRKIPRRPFLPGDKHLSPMIQRVLKRFLREVDQ